MLSRVAQMRAEVVSGVAIMRRRSSASTSFWLMDVGCAEKYSCRLASVSLRASLFFGEWDWLTCSSMLGFWSPLIVLADYRVPRAN